MGVGEAAWVGEGEGVSVGLGAAVGTGGGEGVSVGIGVAVGTGEGEGVLVRLGAAMGASDGDDVGVAGCPSPPQAATNPIIAKVQAIDTTGFKLNRSSCWVKGLANS